MRIPKSLVILEKTWRVEYKWNLTFNKKAVYGICDPNSRTIFIDRSLSKEDKLKTFVHEYMHAVLDEHRIGHNANHISITKEERIIETLEAEILENFNLRWKQTPDQRG